MLSSIFSKRAFIFYFLLFSSLGFSVGIIVVRVFLDNDALSYILNLQGIVVFTSFILQFGLRASLRVSIYKNRVRLADVSEQSLYFILVVFGTVALLFEFILSKTLFFCLSSLLAIVTLRLTLSVARNKTLLIYFFSVVNFAVAVGSSIILLIFRDFEISGKVIEVFSLLGIFLMYKKIYLKNILRYKKVVLLVYFKAQSYQLGSGVIALFVFLLNQSVVAQFKDKEYLSAYSDAVILSGFLVLLVGKGMLLFERRFYEYGSNKLIFYSFMIVFQSFLSLVFLVFVSFFYEFYDFIFFVVVFVLLSRSTAGYIVQYVETKRNILNLFSLVFFVGYVFIYCFYFKYVSVYFHIYPVIFYLFIGFLLFFYEKK